MTAFQQTFEALESFNQGFEQRDPLVAFRRKALSAFKGKGLPSRKDEDWKYTSLRSLEKADFNWSRSPGMYERKKIKDLMVAEAFNLVFVDGVFDSSLSDRDVPPGLEITSLARPTENGNERQEILEFLRQFEQMPCHSLTLLNQAFLNEGLWLRVQAGVELERPLHVVYYHSAKPKPFALFPMNLIQLEPSAAMVMTEVYFGSEPGANYFSNAGTSVLLKENSRLGYYKAQVESNSAYHVGVSRVIQQRDSVFESFILTAGGRLSRNDMDVVLAAPGADSTINSLYLSTGDQHVDNHSMVEHRVANATSSQLCKGVLDGKSRGVFHGRVVVGEGASGTAAWQMNRSLMLSNEAEVNTRPQLEIDNDDVKCSHGASVGRIKDEELFYLMSRGIPLQESERMLARAFAMEALLKAAHKPFIDYCLKLLEGREQL